MTTGIIQSLLNSRTKSQQMFLRQKTASSCRLPGKTYLLICKCEEQHKLDGDDKYDHGLQKKKGNMNYLLQIGHRIIPIQFMVRHWICEIDHYQKHEQQTSGQRRGESVHSLKMKCYQWRGEHQTIRNCCY